MVLQDSLKAEKLIREIQELARLAEQLTVQTREMHSELTELEEQLDLIRQFQVVPSVQIGRTRLATFFRSRNAAVH